MSIGTESMAVFYVGTNLKQKSSISHVLTYDAIIIIIQDLKLEV